MRVPEVTLHKHRVLGACSAAIRVESSGCHFLKEKKVTIAWKRVGKDRKSWEKLQRGWLIIIS
jgi:hypothetical protein